MLDGMTSKHRERLIVGGATAGIALPVTATAVGTQWKTLHAVDRTGRADVQVANANARLNTGRWVGASSVFGFAAAVAYANIRKDDDGALDWASGGMIAAGSAATMIGGSGTRSVYSVTHATNGDLRPRQPATNVLERVNRIDPAIRPGLPTGFPVLQKMQRLLRG